MYKCIIMYIAFDFIAYMQYMAGNFYSSLGAAWVFYIITYVGHYIQEMFHAHTKESMLTNKARAIMDCFFLSSVPPKLQVNVPLIVAEELTNKPHGPYLFREAQVRTCIHTALHKYCMLFD